MGVTINKIVKYIISLFLLILLSFFIYNYQLKSTLAYSEFYNAFNIWYEFNHPNYSNSTPKQIFVHVNKNDFNKRKNYIQELQMFKIELSQIDQDKLNYKNKKQIEQIDALIRSLLVDYGEYKYFDWNVHHNIEYIYKYIFETFYSSETQSIRSDKIDNVIKYLPDYLNHLNDITDYTYYNNNFTSIYTLNKIKSLFKLINESSNNKHKLEKLNNSIDNFTKSLNQIVEDKNDYSIYNEHVNNYFLDSLEYSNYIDKIKKIQYRTQVEILNIALPIYMIEQDEPEWLDFKDTLDVVSYVLYNSSIEDTSENYTTLFNEALIDINKNFSDDFYDLEFDYDLIDNMLYDKDLLCSFNNLINLDIDNSFNTNILTSRINNLVVENLLLNQLIKRFYSYNLDYIDTNMLIGLKSILSRILIEDEIVNEDSTYLLAVKLNKLRMLNVILLKDEIYSKVKNQNLINFINDNTNDFLQFISHEGFYNLENIDFNDKSESQLEVNLMSILNNEVFNVDYFIVDDYEILEKFHRKYDLVSIKNKSFDKIEFIKLLINN